jgi:hypothetical protein
MFEKDKIVKLNFELGFSNKKILQILAHSDGVIISISTLKRKLKSLKLFRTRKNHPDLLNIACFILTRLETSEALHGYRWMHLKCRQSGHSVLRDTVHQLMKLLDPKEFNVGEGGGYKEDFTQVQGLTLCCT